jgi:molybdopterin-guanine dinucleotide biosynthesis protein A
LIPNAPAWAQTPDVRTEAIITAGILLGLASLLRRNMATRAVDSPQISQSSLRDAA